jgi:hypothetical protein
MPKRAGLLLFLLFAAAFLLVNRDAYRGYFQDDEIDNLSWAPRLPASDYLLGVLSPRYSPNSFRPAGHFFFHAAGRAFDLDFPRYVAVIHLLHLFNVWLIWLVARRLGAAPLAAAAACLFFGLHMALFDAFWKPMYVFDVLCAAFCLLSLLFWMRGGWLASLAAFWLAYKSKELAVMLPAVLLCYELWFGRRRWKALAPFFAVSLLFGVQALLLNPNHDNDYTFRPTLAALAATVPFYLGRVFLVPAAGLLAIAVVLIARDRRAWFGLSVAVIFLLPLLFLPGRMFSAYCYLPFAGLALAFAGVAGKLRPAWLALFFLLWLPWDYRALRAAGRDTLDRDARVRSWMGTLAAFTRNSPPLDAYIYSGAPEGFHRWGVEGALRYFLGAGDFKIAESGEPETERLPAAARVALLNWDPPTRRLTIVTRAPDSGDRAYIEMGPSMQASQLEAGWYGLEGDYRWIAPAATARLARPAGARRFELRVNLGTELLRDAGPITVRVSLDGVDLDPRRFTAPGWQTAAWELAPAPAGMVRVAFLTQPPYRPPHDARVLGIAIGGFGFR